jgi:hypothetical protein
MGTRPNRWQRLHMVCKYRVHHKPVYFQRHLAAIEQGNRDKMHFTKSLQDDAVGGFCWLPECRRKNVEITSSPSLCSRLLHTNHTTVAAIVQCVVTAVSALAEKINYLINNNLIYQ